MAERVSISTSNRKTGTASVSLPPGEACVPGIACFTKEGCYAWKMYFNTNGLYTNVKSAWDRNMRVWKADAANYFSQVFDWLNKNRPEYFRWHVGGDFPSLQYLESVREVAKLTPYTRHTAYTKRYDWLPVSPDEFGPNMNVMPSGWPGIPMPERIIEKYGIFWLDNPKEPDVRIPEDTIDCPGSCPGCRWCWNTYMDVKNRKH